jgi:hypothetical protein
VADETDRAHVRLAELVAALSLAIDLGFGQPMEHVLRQCLIALRLAERVGLDDQRRADVYYTALLVNVGCHSDAHEQAKWFGDDIALKAGKYDHEARSLGATAATLRLLGAGNAPSHRFRIALEFALSGHREVADMINHHAAMTRAFGEQLGLPVQALDALSGAYETWDGRGWPGELKGANVPLAARLAQLAEFVEVAHRIGGVEAAKRLARERASKQFDPDLAELVCTEGELILSGLDDVETWDAVIDAEPALTVMLSAERFDAALLAIANFVDLKSPYSLGHSRAVADLAAAAGGQLGLSEAEVRTIWRARPWPAGRVKRDLGQTRAARRRRMGARAPASTSDRADAQTIGGPRAAGCDRGPAPRAPRRLRLSPRTQGRRDLPPRSDPRRR